MAIASLVLTKRLMQLDCDRASLERWLVFRQQGGFQGRCNKDPDSCYAFWNGATLRMLGKHSFVDIESCREFVMSCQFPYGGFCKYPNTVPDVMHSYYSLAWLSIAECEGDELVPLDVKLQVPYFKTSH